MDQIMSFVEPGRQFAKDSIRLVKRCTKPDRKGIKRFVINHVLTNSRHSTDSNLCWTEFQKIAMATAIGFAIMGFIGFFVKLIHIPINNIIVYVLKTKILYHLCLIFNINHNIFNAIIFQNLMIYRIILYFQRIINTWIFFFLAVNRKKIY